MSTHTHNTSGGCRTPRAFALRRAGSSGGEIDVEQNLTRRGSDGHVLSGVPDSTDADPHLIHSIAKWSRLMQSRSCSVHDPAPEAACLSASKMRWLDAEGPRNPDVDPVQRKLHEYTRPAMANHKCKQEQEQLTQTHTDTFTHPHPPPSMTKNSTKSTNTNSAMPGRTTKRLCPETLTLPPLLLLLPLLLVLLPPPTLLPPKTECPGTTTTEANPPKRPAYEIIERRGRGLNARKIYSKKTPRLLPLLLLLHVPRQPLLTLLPSTGYTGTTTTEIHPPKHPAAEVIERCGRGLNARTNRAPRRNSSGCPRLGQRFRLARAGRFTVQTQTTPPP